jgi:uncharacterized membrane protein (DUF106 family)
MFSAVYDMKPADLLTLLAIIIALSAYLATVRLFALDRLTKLKEGLENISNQLDENLEEREVGNLGKTKTRLEERITIHLKLCLLLFADVPMTVSAVLLGIYILYGKPACFLRTSVILFTIAGLVLLFNHVYAWIKSIYAWIMIVRKARK